MVLLVCGIAGVRQSWYGAVGTVYGIADLGISVLLVCGVVLALPGRYTGLLACGLSLIHI